MATVSVSMPPPSTSTSRPFASLDGPRLQSFLKAKKDLKNKQNGPNTPKPCKSRIPVEDAESENIDPATLINPPMKRKRGVSDEGDEADEDPVKLSPKMHQLKTLLPVDFKNSINVNQHKTPLTPTKPQRFLKPTARPAGRSPRTAKACRAFGRRSPISKSRSRPELRAKKGVVRPFSIPAALSSNSKPSSKSSSSSTSAPAAPSSWFFEIHVDSPQEEMTNLVLHSTCILDITDDEHRQKRAHDGKENTPPQELGMDLPGSRQQVAAAAPPSKKKDAPEDRSPLGELNASDYYAAGCNAFSCVIVHDDETEDVVEENEQPAKAAAQSA